MQSFDKIKQQTLPKLQEKLETRVKDSISLLKMQYDKKLKAVNKKIEDQINLQKGVNTSKLSDSQENDRDLEEPVPEDEESNQRELINIVVRE